jgi:hypothetical protein
VGEGADLYLGGADFEGSYYWLRSDCTRPQAMMRVGAGGVPN